MAVEDMSDRIWQLSARSSLHGMHMHMLHA